MSAPGLFAQGRILLGETLSALGKEIGELDRPGPRARLCVMAALSVALSVLAALALRLDNPWWAGISGYVSIQASGAGSIKRGAMRILGTAAGAAVGVVLAPSLVYDHAACCAFVFLATAVGVLGMSVSSHGVAWLFAGITSVLVVFMSLDTPAISLTIGVYRFAEVTVGTTSALLIASLLGSDEPTAAPAAAPPGWTDLIGARWPAVMHATRSGIAVALLPFLWNWLQLPSLSQIAITVTAVMAVPILSDDAQGNARKLVERGLHRMLGCLFGGFAGLGALALSTDALLPWLVVLTAGVWVGMHVQASVRGVGYAGTQGAVVFIMTLVQGYGPPASIMPGIDRFAGIFCGLGVLLLISILLAPAPPPAPKDA